MPMKAPIADQAAYARVQIRLSRFLMFCSMICNQILILTNPTNVEIYLTYVKQKISETSLS